VAWRARSPHALERRVAAIEATGLGRGWIDGDVGHGRAYQFDTPEGHPMELLWDVDYVTAGAGKETPLRNIEEVLHGDVVEADMVEPPEHIRRLRHDRDIVRKVGDAQKARQNRSVVVIDHPLTFAEAERGSENRKGERRCPRPQERSGSTSER
jgi:hypothetical protein